MKSQIENKFYDLDNKICIKIIGKDLGLYYEIKNLKDLKKFKKIIDKLDLKFKDTQ